eukprot:508644_1
MSQKISSKDKIAFQRYEIYKKRLQAILKQKNPKKINAIDALLTKYRGKEHAVYVKVCGKYGIKPKPEWTPNNKQKPNNNKINNNNIKPKTKQTKKQLIPKPPIQQTKLKSKPLTKHSNISKKAPQSKSTIKRTNLRQNKMKNNLSKLKNKKITQKSFIKPAIMKKQIPQIKNKIKIIKQEESEDEYEDDFEDYSDDFETEEPEMKSQSHIPRKKPSILNQKTEKKSNVLIKKYNIKSSKTNILFEMRESTVHEKYLKRVGTEIFSRGVQSIYSQNIETQTVKHKMESKMTQYQFCDPTNVKNINYDRKRLISFLQKSSKVMNGLLACNNNDNTSKQVLCEKKYKFRSIFK